MQYYPGAVLQGGWTYNSDPAIISSSVRCFCNQLWNKWDIRPINLFMLTKSSESLSTSRFEYIMLSILSCSYFLPFFSFSNWICRVSMMMVVCTYMDHIYMSMVRYSRPPSAPSSVI